MRPPPRSCVVAVGWALALAPAVARADWSSPTTISAPTSAVDDLQVVAGADGRALSTWRFRIADLAGLHAVSRRPDGAWGPIRTLGTFGLSTARTTGTGDGLFDLTAYARSRAAGLAVTPGRGRGAALDLWKGNTYGRLTRSTRIAPDPWDVGGLAITPEGATAVTWTWMAPRRGSGSNARPRVVMFRASRTSTGAFSTPRRLSPLPPPPPYGENRGPALSATVPTIGRRGRTVVVAWQRVGKIEARVSQDSGRTFRPVRRLGTSEQAFPGVTVGVARDRQVVVAWSTVTGTAGARRITTRVSAGAPDGPLRTSLVSRSAAVDLPFAVADQFGPTVRLAFAAGGPVLAWQDVEGSTIVARTRPLADAMLTSTERPADGAVTVLEDLVVGADGRTTVAWRTVTPGGDPVGAWTRTDGGTPVPVPAAAPVTRLRLAATPIGLLAAASIRRGSGAAALAFREVPALGAPSP